MQPICPKCASVHVGLINRARKIVGIVALVAGMLIALIGTRWPARKLPETLIRAIATGTTGCAIGSAFGQVIDDQILDNQCCLSCGHRFSAALA